MIDIFNDFISFIDEAEDNLKSLIYEALILLINRGELELGSLGFWDKYTEIIKKKD